MIKNMVKNFIRMVVCVVMCLALDFSVQAQNYLTTFQVSITATTATQLPSNVFYNVLYCVPSTNNTTQVLFGGSSSVASNGVAISNGQIWGGVWVGNSNLVWVYSTASAAISCWGN